MEKRIVRFEIQDLLPIGLTLVVAGIGIVYGMSVMSDIKSGFCGGGLEHQSGGSCLICPNSTYNRFLPGETGGNICTNVTAADVQGYNSSDNATAGLGGNTEWNASQNAIRGVAKIPEKMPLIATVIIAAIIIGILVRYLMVRFT